MAAVLMAFIFC